LTALTGSYKIHKERFYMNPKANNYPNSPKREEKADIYGLTAVTLGQVLKGKLDQIAGANGNRSEILRAAFESYLQQVPKLREEARRRESELRARALPIVFYRILTTFHEMFTRSIDYPNAFPQDLLFRFTKSLSDLETWLEQRIPSPDEEGKLSVPFPEIENALRALEHAEFLLWRADSGRKWTQAAVEWGKTDQVPIGKSNVEG
jgi:hypothetical protein